MKKIFIALIFLFCAGLAPPGTRRLPLDPVRPAQPPDPERYIEPAALPHPEPHPQARKIAAAAWSRAIAEHTSRPGETAFRETVHAFVEHNREFAEAQAEREGLTMEEVEELTYFGLMVQETQRFGEVAQILGRELTADEREGCETLMHELNRDFKTRMRALVAARAKPDVRWALIRETQAEYRSTYFALTGMNAEQLDDLLAGDAARAYAVATNPPPEDPPPAEGEDPTHPIERPLQPEAASPELDAHQSN